MWRKILLSLLVITLIVTGCSEPEGVLEPCDALSSVDREMLDLVAQIEQDYKDDREFINAFKESQIYWTQYRNRQVKAVYPLSPRKYDYDVGACKCEVMTDLTLARVEELKKWTDGVAAGGCLGTFKQKRN